MDEESYRFERILTFFAILMIIVILFTALTFFDVIEPNKWAKEYCISSDKFNCQEVNVNFNSIKISIQYKGPGLDSFAITSKNSGCKIFQRANILRNQLINVNIECTLTASKGKNYADKLTIMYTEVGTLSKLEEEIELKTTVK